MNNKILHVVHNDKFSAPFIRFLKDNNIYHGQTFLYWGGAPSNVYPIPHEENVSTIQESDSKLQRLSILLRHFYAADKVILHSLFTSALIRFLYLQPWLLRKCYWVIWGGDLYYHIEAKDSKSYASIEKRRKRVIGNFGGIICYNRAEYELAEQWYGAKGQFIQSFFYPSNLYEKLDIEVQRTSTVYIQIGNSSDWQNQHIEVLEKLEPYKDEDMILVVPLSYGNASQSYIDEVIHAGHSIFGSKFMPLTSFMEFDKYLEILGRIDIAIFNRNRQQAMGNITTLLGLGKKIYMKNSITSWQLFKELDIKVFDVSDFDLALLDDAVKRSNMEKIKEYFSREHLVEQWRNILGIENSIVSRTDADS